MSRKYFFYLKYYNVRFRRNIFYFFFFAKRLTDEITVRDCFVYCRLVICKYCFSQLMQTIFEFTSVSNSWRFCKIHNTATSEDKKTEHFYVQNIFCQRIGLHTFKHSPLFEPLSIDDRVSCSCFPNFVCDPYSTFTLNSAGY